MYECERLFGIARGLEIQEQVHAATGDACPCKRGLGCLLTPVPVVVIAEPAEVA